MNKLLHKIKTSKLFYFIADSSRRLLMLCFSVFPLQNKIFVSSYFGGDYGDNAKYILEELNRQEHHYKIIWLLKKDLMGRHHLPPTIQPVAYGSIASFFHMATARVWLNNSRFTYALRKRRGQIYIQTWHGGPGMKKVEQDAAESLDRRYVYFAKKDSQMTDYYLSNSRFMTRLFSNAFWYQGKIIECGTPRNDIFFKDTTVYSKKIRAFYGLDDNCKIVVYGPTFRKDHNLSVYAIDASRCCQALSTRFGGNWVLLMRLHPNLYELAENLNTDGNKIINATKYPDAQELFAAADCLITDYSSMIIDFIPTGRPGFTFATDVENYMDDRGFYFTFQDLPFPFAGSNDQLVENILSFNAEKYQADLQSFCERTGLVENGHAAQKAVEFILASMRK